MLTWIQAEWRCLPREPQHVCITGNRAQQRGEKQNQTVLNGLMYDWGCLQQAKVISDILKHIQTILFQTYWNTSDQKVSGEYFWEECCQDLFGKKIVTFLTTNTDTNPVMFHMNRNSKLTQLSLLHGFGKMGTQCSYIFSIGKMKLFCFAKSTRWHLRTRWGEEWKTTHTCRVLLTIFVNLQGFFSSWSPCKCYTMDSLEQQ